MMLATRSNHALDQDELFDRDPGVWVVIVDLNVARGIGRDDCGQGAGFNVHTAGADVALYRLG